MGQYHYVVNLDKHEFLHPHALGDGLKLGEFAYSAGGTMTALAILLAVSNGRGGGDFRRTEDSDNIAEQVIGRWGGNRIAIVGDYAERSDLPDHYHAEDIYSDCADGLFTDITHLLREYIHYESGGERGIIFTNEPGSHYYNRKWAHL